MDAIGLYRPIVGVRLHHGGAVLNPRLPVKCLLDTGAHHTLLRWEIAEGVLGIDLRQAEDHADIRVGGHTRRGVKWIHAAVEIPAGNGEGPLVTPEAPILFIKGELPTAGIIGAVVMRSFALVFREYEGRVAVRDVMDFCNGECPHHNGKHPL